MRGQISLDIILAIAIALIALSSTIILSEDISETQSKASIRNQLKTAGTGLATVISTSAIMNNTDNVTIEYTVPKILVAGETKTQECLISIVDTDLQLTYELYDTNTGESEIIWTKVPFVSPVGMTLVPTLAAGDKLKCGQTITITKT